MNLASNIIGDAGALALATLLESGVTLPALEEISLAANRIRDVGCASLLRCGEAAESACPQLQLINLRANRIRLESVGTSLDDNPQGARLIGMSLREQLLDIDDDDDRGDALSSDGEATLDATLLHLQPRVAHRAAEAEAQRAAEDAARATAAEAARIAAEELAQRQAEELVAAAEREAVEEAARESAAAELAAVEEERAHAEAEARQLAMAQLAEAAEEERLEAERRAHQYEMRMLRRQALEEKRLEAEAEAKRLAAEARRITQERVKRDAAEKARKADEERVRRVEREAHRRALRESSVAANVAKGLEAQAREAQAAIRRLEGLHARESSRAETAKQNAGRQEAARQDAARHEEQQMTLRRTESTKRALYAEARRVDALADAARKATGARKAAQRSLQHTPTPRPASAASVEPAAPAERPTNPVASSATLHAPRVTTSQPRQRPRSAPPVRPERQLMVAGDGSSSSVSRSNSVERCGGRAGVGGVGVPAKGILRGSSAPGSPRSASPTCDMGDESAAPSCASPTTEEGPRTRTVRFLGESRMGTTFPTRDAPRKQRAGKPVAVHDATSSPRSPRKASARPEAVAGRHSFLVQPCGGHTGTEFVKDALLRRGWTEMPGAGDSNHVRRCLALSRGLKFVWLRGGDPLSSDYPTKMAAVSNRWPRKPSAGGGLGLGALWAKSGLLQTLDGYYSAQGLDPWRHHPLSFRLPQGAQAGNPEWESFGRVFDAVANGADERVPASQGAKNLWLLKPTNGSCGKGIGVAGSLDELRRHYAGSEGGGEWVVQKYVEAPLLYAGRKFDVRIFALLESASSNGAKNDFAWTTDLGLRLYVHREGYGRTTSEDFSLKETHNTMHLTNYAVQKGARHAGRYEKGNCVSFADLEKQLGPEVGWSEKVVPRMHALIADAVLAARPELLDTLHAANTPHANYRTLLAFDLIVEEDGHPLLLEINPYPGMAPQSDWHGRYLKRVMDDYVGACVDTTPA